LETSNLKTHSIASLTVRSAPGKNPETGIISVGNRHISCRLGKNGITPIKREGDSCTPAGDFRLLYGWYRHDRLGTIRSELPLRKISANDGWCDDPAAPLYNQPITLPARFSHEVMYRKDRLYDICLVMDYNIQPRARGLGSAIFFHLTNLDGRGTEGCIAIDPEEMRLILPKLSDRTKVKIRL